MRTLVFTILSSSVAFFAVTTGHAADAIDEVPAAPAAEYTEPAAKDWSGAHVGGTVNWARGDFDATGKRGAAGFGGGAYAGYDMQNGQLVYGGEADINYGDNDTHGRRGTLQQGVNGSIRARVGVDVDPVLVYGTAGLAASSVKASNGSGSDRNTLYGLTAGVGAETFVTKNVTARVEYRYTDYGSKDFDLPSGRVSSDYQENTVRVGVGVKF